MLDQIINNFIFSRLLYIVIVTLIGFAVISDLKKKDKIEIKEYLNVKKINITLLFKYLFLSFIVRILLEQLVIFLNTPATAPQVPVNILEIIADISILVTSIVFALIHFYNIDGFIILLGISLIWHYSFYKTNNLIYPILLHFFHNLYAVSDNLLGYSNYWYILLGVSIIGYIITITKKQKN